MTTIAERIKEAKGEENLPLSPQQKRTFFDTLYKYADREQSKIFNWEQRLYNEFGSEYQDLHNRNRKPLRQLHQSLGDLTAFIAAVRRNKLI